MSKGSKSILRDLNRKYEILGDEILGGGLSVPPNFASLCPRSTSQQSPVLVMILYAKSYRRRITVLCPLFPPDPKAQSSNVWFRPVRPLIFVLSKLFLV